MSEKNQDQRPVYMGTFSKYTKSFSSKLDGLNSDVERQKKFMRDLSTKLEITKKMVFYGVITVIFIQLAILLLYLYF